MSDKFKIGDKVYYVEDDIYSPGIGIVIDYKADGFGWLDWVKYKVEFKGRNGPRTWFLGNNSSPDVLSAKVYSEKEYSLEIAKLKYQEIIDHGNGD